MKQRLIGWLCAIATGTSVAKEADWNAIERLAEKHPVTIHVHGNLVLSQLNSDHVQKTNVHAAQGTQVAASSESEASPDIDIEPYHTPTAQSFSVSIAPIGWILNHKIKTLFFSTILTYATLWSLLNKTKRYAISDNSWSTWQGHQSLAELQDISKETLRAQLAHDIKLKYHTDHHTIVHQLLAFQTDIHREMRNITRYRTIHRTLKFLRLSRVFTLDPAILKKAERRIRRLEYVQELFRHLSPKELVSR